MNDDRYMKILLVTVALAVLLACGALLVVAINLGATLVSSSMLLIFQVLFSIATVLIVGCLVGAIVFKLYKSIVEQLANLESKYADLSRRLGQRRPAFVSTATIVAAMVTLLSDKAFGEENVPAVCVGIVLILLFWVANELLVAGTQVRFIFGIAVWFFGVVLTPIVMLIQQHGDVSALVHSILRLNLGMMAMVIASVVLACVAPLTLRNDG
jgi:hypothetical protein